MEVDVLGMDHLVVIETQKTKQYLFASPYLRETRGASVLLDLLNRQKIQEILTEMGSAHHAIYLGGGSGRVLFRDRDVAEDFKNKILTLYRCKTVSARIAVAIEPRGDADSFATWMRRGVEAAQAQKLGLSRSVPQLAGRWIRPCTSCGQAPAETMLTEHGEHLLCRACLLKRREIRNLYSKIKPGEYRARPLRPAGELTNRYGEASIFTTLVRATEADGYRPLLPQDFDDIGTRSRPANYMGFIYADGNAMGEVVRNIGQSFPDDQKVMEAYCAFSEIVDQATREAAVEAVLESVGPGEPEKTEDGILRWLPAEFILAGGDDLMLAVPGDCALETAIRFLEKFQAKTEALQRERLERPFAKHGLTTSAGIVLAHAHHPASDLMELAGGLMKLAKNRAARLAAKAKAAGLPPVGTLDFMILAEAGTEPATARRNREYRYSNERFGTFHLTERPYTAAEARLLLQTIRDLKDAEVPRSKLKALYPMLFETPRQAMFSGQRILERLQSTDALKGRLKSLADELKPFPFRRCEDHDRRAWSTPISEIIELYDFVHAAPEQSAGGAR